MSITPVQSSLIHKILMPEGDARQQYPVLVLLHGRGTNEDDLLGLVPYLDPRLLVISARAPFQFSMGGWTWYEIQEVGTPHPRQFQESYNRLVQFLADIKQHYPVDPGKIFFLGFSMGTVMSFAISLTKPQDIAGVVAHSGYVPENTQLTFALDTLQSTSFFVAHGTQDPIIPIHFGRRAKELLTSARADLTYREYPIAHQISEESLTDLSAWLSQRLEGLQKKM